MLGGSIGTDLSEYNLPHCFRLMYFLYFIFILYVGVFITLALGDSADVNRSTVYWARPSGDLNSLSLSHIKLAYMQKKFFCM